MPNNICRQTKKNITNMSSAYFYSKLLLYQPQLLKTHLSKNTEHYVELFTVFDVISALAPIMAPGVLLKLAYFTIQ